MASDITICSIIEKVTGDLNLSFTCIVRFTYYISMYKMKNLTKHLLEEEDREKDHKEISQCSIGRKNIGRHISLTPLNNQEFN
jgi:hypothetical protein